MDGFAVYDLSQPEVEHVVAWFVIEQEAHAYAAQKFRGQFASVTTWQIRRLQIQRLMAMSEPTETV